jgi:hypothetical protein
MGSPSQRHRAATVTDRVSGTFTLVAWLLTATLLYFVWAGLTDPALYDRLSRKDDLESTGLIEHLTVLVLLPGIAAGIFALIRFRRSFPSPLHAGWLLMWTAACVYFAGEECSWGQWYLGFDTPQVIDDINKQDEFNLHNTTSWLNEKPRAMVELFIVAVGLALPVAARLPGGGPLRAARERAARPWPAWVFAPPMCWAAAAYFVLIRVLDWTGTPESPTIDSELRELAVAWFLSLYLISYPLRLRHPSQAEPSA